MTMMYLRACMRDLHTPLPHIFIWLEDQKRPHAFFTTEIGGFCEEDYADGSPQFRETLLRAYMLVASIKALDPQIDIGSAEYALTAERKRLRSINRPDPFDPI